MGLALGIILVIVIISIMVIIFRKRTSGNHRSSSNVIELKSRSINHRQDQVQACSKCGRKRPLIFYANDAGSVKGLCKECKRELEQHQDLYPV
ncbi:hypothetical protein [Peribacillus sp. NPDC056705]|uniref:hypothetical protein n=1 Tax=Peribacillus sp. NPDC056705 TaxID=3345918 RepID=UPI003748072E